MKEKVIIKVRIKVKHIPDYHPPYKERKHTPLIKELEAFLVGMEIKRHHQSR